MDESQTNKSRKLSSLPVPAQQQSRESGMIEGPPLSDQPISDYERQEQPAADSVADMNRDRVPSAHDGEIKADSATDVGEPTEKAEKEAGIGAPRKVRKKGSKIGSGRGVETMFRTSYRVHVDLTALADNKANIMISINGLIIPIMLFALVPLLQFSGWLIFPSITLVLTCLVSIVYAVLSARPRINPNPVTRTSIQANRANILFFGNFAHLTESEFLDGMTSMMEEVDSIYLSMMRDIYGLGKVLSVKFALLQRAYTVFMIGLVASILLFLSAFVFLALESAGKL